MTWEIAVVLMLVAFALVQFLRERWPTDLTGLSVFAVLLLLSQIPNALGFFTAWAREPRAARDRPPARHAAP